MSRSTTVKWEALEAELKRLKKADLLELLGFAFDALPRTRIEEVFGEHVDLAALTARPRRAISGTRLLEKVREFHEESLKGRYYQGFNVNSKNYRETSEGTRRWNDEHERLFQQCVAVSDKGQHEQAREAMDLLFDLLRRIDHGEDFLFFADEQGSWQVHVDYDEVLPAYIASLAATTEPKEYADGVHEIIDTFGTFRPERHLKTARKVATLEQRRELKRQLPHGRLDF